MELYSYYRSSSAWRVRIVLHHKHIPFEYAAVNLAPAVRAQDAEEYASVNPFRQVPTLEWTEGGVVRRLTQSVAISEYLEETHPDPPLLPRDPLERARVREAVEIINSGTQPHHNSSILDAVRRMGGEAAARDWARSALERGLGALETAHRAYGGRFCVGDSLTLADVCLAPALESARRYELDPSRFPALLDVEGLTRTLDAFQRAHANAQPDAPRTGGSP